MKNIFCSYFSKQWIIFFTEMYVIEKTYKQYLKEKKLNEDGEIFLNITYFQNLTDPDACSVVTTNKKK